MKKYLLAAVLVALIAAPLSADLSNDNNFYETAYTYAPQFNSSSLVGGPTVVYDSLQGIANAGLASNDLDAVWGDTITMIDTGRLNELTFTVFNSSGGGNTGSLDTADITFSFFDASTFDGTDFASNTAIGSFTGALDFTDGGGLGAGFFATPTFFGLDEFAIDLLTTELVVTQQLSNVTGGAARAGVVGFDTVSIGAAADTVFISASDVGPDGFYSVGFPTFLGYTVNLTNLVPEPASAGLIGLALLGGYFIRRHRA